MLFDCTEVVLERREVATEVAEASCPRSYNKTPLLVVLNWFEELKRLVPTP